MNRRHALRSAAAIPVASIAFLAASPVAAETTWDGCPPVNLKIDGKRVRVEFRTNDKKAINDIARSRRVEYFGGVMACYAAARYYNRVYVEGTLVYEGAYVVGESSFPLVV